MYGYQFSYPENYVVFSKIDSNANIIPVKNDDFEVEVAKNSGLLTQGESATLNFKIVKTTLSPKAWLTQHLTDYTTPSEGRISDENKFMGENAAYLYGADNLGSVYKVIVVSRLDNLLVINQNTKDATLEKIIDSIGLQ
jgi:hypothetical protein